ncbi:hypothetical protein [Chlorobium sp.]|uniref:hypothetical protein n=1 Tax=Chlorobium sp. TaxID=1095 RepID=UPI002F3F9129
MMLLFLHVILLASAWNLPREFREYRTLQEAYMLYRNGDFSGAEQRCRQMLAETSGQNGRKSFAIRFNLAGTLAMQKKYLPARTIYRNLAMNHHATGEIRNASVYNEGNCLAQEAIEAGKSERKRDFFEQALQRYIAVLRDKPGDMDARINYEIVLRMLEKLKTGSGSEQENSRDRTETASTANGRMNTAERLLRQAQMQENRTMRLVPYASSGGKEERSGGKDW